MPCRAAVFAFFLYCPKNACAKRPFLVGGLVFFSFWWPRRHVRLSVSDLWRRLIPGRSRSSSSVTFLFSCPGCCAVQCNAAPWLLARYCSMFVLFAIKYADMLLTSRCQGGARAPSKTTSGAERW